jgi:hypothetical protein
MHELLRCCLCHAHALSLERCHDLVPDIVHVGIDGRDGSGALGILLAPGDSNHE